MIEPKRCACVVVPMPSYLDSNGCDHRILVVETKKHGRTTVGLPGGKLEPGELFIEGARRELLEETGIDDLWLEHLWTETYQSVHTPDQEIITETFLGQGLVPRGQKGVYEHFKTPEGVARPGTWEELISPGGGSPYYLYNRNVLLMFHQWLFSNPNPKKPGSTSLIYKHFSGNPFV